ncbi:hypothetical protein AVME950_03545 [Acidovorax sp. SUPP950]|uniref:hypothetical protein n=1 Tax=Acidovorax sp. SUPP950 TaxID=511901 RepID=UPI0023CDB532|nr:hypothetical protein [Acidovorax sp. SUPP950]GKS73927.1 hypothetical protein AVME950_03545 [Acidovorax sp. SUPP950]
MLRVLAWSFAAVAVLAGGWFGRTVPFAEQWPVFEGLRTTAAIIFGVIGAWLAIIYPERLKLSFKPKNNGGPSETGVGQLFSPVVNSTLILGAVLLIGVIAPIAKKYPLPLDVAWCRAISYGVLVALTLFQLWTVLLTLVPANTIKSFVDHEDEAKRVIEGLTSLNQENK